VEYAKRNLRFMGPGTEAPVQARRTADELALEALRLDYGHVYLIGCDEDRGWWASPHGVVGEYLTEDTPGGLRAAIAAHYRLRGVQWGRAL
jgi:hypothetical protein